MGLIRGYIGTRNQVLQEIEEEKRRKNPFNYRPTPPEKTVWEVQRRLQALCMDYIGDDIDGMVTRRLREMEYDGAISTFSVESGKTPGTSIIRLWPTASLDHWDFYLEHVTGRIFPYGNFEGEGSHTQQL